jgi:hypothetical protein
MADKFRRQNTAAPILFIWCIKQPIGRMGRHKLGQRPRLSSTVGAAAMAGGVQWAHSANDAETARRVKSRGNQKLVLAQVHSQATAASHSFKFARLSLMAAVASALSSTVLFVLALVCALSSHCPFAKRSPPGNPDATPRNEDTAPSAGPRREETTPAVDPRGSDDDDSWLPMWAWLAIGGVLALMTGFILFRSARSAIRAGRKMLHTAGATWLSFVAYGWWPFSNKPGVAGKDGNNGQDKVDELRAEMKTMEQGLEAARAAENTAKEDVIRNGRLLAANAAPAAADSAATRDHHVRIMRELNAKLKSAREATAKAERGLDELRAETDTTRQNLEAAAPPGTVEALYRAVVAAHAGVVHDLVTGSALTLRTAVEDTLVSPPSDTEIVRVIDVARQTANGINAAADAATGGVVVQKKNARWMVLSALFAALAHHGTHANAIGAASMLAASPTLQHVTGEMGRARLLGHVPFNPFYPVSLLHPRVADEPVRSFARFMYHGWMHTPADILRVVLSPLVTAPSAQHQQPHLPHYQGEALLNPWSGTEAGIGAASAFATAAAEVDARGSYAHWALTTAASHALCVTGGFFGPVGGFLGCHVLPALVLGETDNAVEAIRNAAGAEVARRALMHLFATPAVVEAAKGGAAAVVRLFAAAGAAEGGVSAMVQLKILATPGVVEALKATMLSPAAGEAMVEAMTKAISAGSMEPAGLAKTVAREGSNTAARNLFGRG